MSSIDPQLPYRQNLQSIGQYAEDVAELELPTIVAGVATLFALSVRLLATVTTNSAAGLVSALEQQTELQHDRNERLLGIEASLVNMVENDLEEVGILPTRRRPN